jgi:hypothetical protein
METFIDVPFSIFAKNYLRLPHAINHKFLPCYQHNCGYQHCLPHQVPATCRLTISSISEIKALTSCIESTTKTSFSSSNDFLKSSAFSSIILAANSGFSAPKVLPDNVSLVIYKITKISLTDFTTITSLIASRAGFPNARHITSARHPVSLFLGSWFSTSPPLSKSTLSDINPILYIFVNQVRP